MRWTPTVGQSGVWFEKGSDASSDFHDGMYYQLLGMDEKTKWGLDQHEVAKLGPPKTPISQYALSGTYRFIRSYSIYTVLTLLICIRFINQLISYRRAPPWWGWSSWGQLSTDGCRLLGAHQGRRFFFFGGGGELPEKGVNGWGRWLQKPCCIYG